MSEEKRTVTITDSESGKTITVPVENGTIAATSLAQLGLRSYDPAFFNTAICSSKITYIDGDRGILRYRGYAIEELAENSTFLEVAFLLIHGHLPNKPESEQWSTTIMGHTFVHENLTQLMKTFRYDAHPMGMVIASLAAVSFSN
jgi:citrate synthase